MKGYKSIKVESCPIFSVMLDDVVYDEMCNVRLSDLLTHLDYELGLMNKYVNPWYAEMVIREWLSDVPASIRHRIFKIWGTSHNPEKAAKELTQLSKEQWIH